MGIKKNAFLRDFVRAVVASISEKYANVEEFKRLFYSEIEPAYNNAYGNPDRATEAVFNEPQTYPNLNKMVYIDKPGIDALLGGEFRLPNVRNEPDEFVRKLRVGQDSLFNLLKPPDLQYIINVIQTKEYKEIIEDLYEYFRRVVIRDYFVRFDKIRADIEGSMTQPRRDLHMSVRACRVVLSYINSLDQGK
jgi:hypothetical protein